MSASALRTLLGESARFDAEYADGLSSHLPMALVALHRLGADEARLRQFAQRYAARLHPAPPMAPWSAGEPWRDRLGDPAAWPAYRALFRDWLAQEGAADVLPQVLPVLAQGVGAAAFHGPIRSAYALAANHLDELADALAYWACRWFSLGSARAAGTQGDPAPLLGALRIAPPTAGLIAQRMHAVARDAAFAPAVDRLRIDGSTLPALARLAAQGYAASGNFTLLHLVTGAHALRVLLPCFDEDDRLPAVAQFWRAFAAGHAASGVQARGPAAAPAAARAPADWPALVEAAVRSDDDHVIKLVDSSREQEKAYGGEVWRRAAARAACPPAP